MNLTNSELDGKKIIHIDTSNKLYEKKNTGIAYRIIKTNAHKGIGLSLKLKDELKRDLNADYDYARLYAICIYFLIKDDLELFDILVICGDEDIWRVKEYLYLLFLHNKKYSEKIIIGIGELREITGNKRLRSYADNAARSYRKRVFRSLNRQQKGLFLNPIKITYKMICEKWAEIDENLKHSVSGE